MITIPRKPSTPSRLSLKIKVTHKLCEYAPKVTSDDYPSAAFAFQELKAQWEIQTHPPGQAELLDFASKLDNITDVLLQESQGNDTLIIEVLNHMVGEIQNIGRHYFGSEFHENLRFYEEQKALGHQGHIQLTEV